jgi:predicted DNA-binding transcriptional regulator AlpA
VGHRSRPLAAWARKTSNIPQWDQLLKLIKMQNLELLTAVDVAKLLKISESSIWNWQYGRKNPPPGFPPPVKIGTLVRWRSSDIQAFILGLPITTTGRIPQPELAPPAPTAVVLLKPVRGRGRPRKMQPGGMR